MRRDKINTLLMKQDFMVHEQQEPREKKRREEYRNISAQFLQSFKHWIYKLQLISMTGDKILPQRFIFFWSEKHLFSQVSLLIHKSWISPFFLLLLIIEKNKTCVRFRVSVAGDKFNMKQ